MDSILIKLKDKAISTADIDPDDAQKLYEAGQKDPFLLMAYASQIREHFKGRKIGLCAIVNAKSGVCAENCRFCAQSVHYGTDAPVYPLISSQEIIEKGRTAFETGAHHFGIVTSGTRINDQKEWDEIYKAIAGLNEVGIKPCGSLGMLDSETARNLKKSGLFRYHHNLETSRSFFDTICSTHAYDEDIETVSIAKKAGLSVSLGLERKWSTA
jgi:biotin synthase